MWRRLLLSADGAETSSSGDARANDYASGMLWLRGLSSLSVTNGRKHAPAFCDDVNGSTEHGGTYRDQAMKLRTISETLRKLITSYTAVVCTDF